MQDGLPREKGSRLFSRGTWEKLSLESSGLRIVRENPSRNYLHPASPVQVQEVLDHLPEKLTRPIRAVVLRRIPRQDAKDAVEARKRYACILLNAFARDLRMVWDIRPDRRTIRHMEPWCARWSEEEDRWVLQWTREEIRRYYLYHLLLHELGHFHQGDWQARKRREDFAEGFALEWARQLGVLKGKEPR